MSWVNATPQLLPISVPGLHELTSHCRRECRAAGVVGDLEALTRCAALVDYSFSAVSTVRNDRISATTGLVPATPFRSMR